MISLESLNDEIFYIEHLSSEENISEFTVNNSKGKGLELYFRKNAVNNENENIARTYVIRDNNTREIVAYFTLSDTANNEFATQFITKCLKIVQEVES